jgi:hypothetical protein
MIAEAVVGSRLVAELGNIHPDEVQTIPTAVVGGAPAAPAQPSDDPSPKAEEGHSAALEDEWDQATKANDPSRRRAEPHSGEQQLPIAFQDAFDRIYADTACWKKPTESSKPKKKGGFFSFLTACFTPAIEEGTVEYTQRDFILCLQHVAFDPENDVHRRALITVYKGLTKEKGTVGVSGPHYEHVGFQGMNPGTDLRAAGLWGLLQLLYLVERLPKFTAALFAAAIKTNCDFPFALVCLNFSGITLDALKKDKLNSQIRSRRRDAETATMPVSEAMNRFYVGALERFLAEWSEKETRKITDFAAIKAAHIKYALEHADKLAKENYSRAVAFVPARVVKRVTMEDGKPLEFTEF